MPTTIAVADGSNEIERHAASDAVAVQDAVKLVAIVGAWQRLRGAGVRQTPFGHPRKFRRWRSLAGDFTIIRTRCQNGMCRFALLAKLANT